jgi:eukaryotic-like serine/threonine-protein kinase
MVDPHAGDREPPKSSRRQAQSNPPEESTFTAESSSGETRRIGPYRILQKLGEGGMGEVYQAEQERPVHRRVALKLIKTGMDTKEVMGRFESERQALALLNHPNIAQVYDAGSTPEGRPYFAMEYVPGVPITRYCRDQQLSVSDRLLLFCAVCEGVQHAHQKGIIHRDLKPSNILVTVLEDKPVPKIIDFGVAKATARRLTERTVFTEIGFAVGTPGYMSPEQAGTTALDIDTRTDVYALGVLLYELLVGMVPFGPEFVREHGVEAYLHALREKELTRPSTQLGALGEAAVAAAQERGTEPFALARLLRGDLDWIVLKAMEKDRTRRYSSAAELAADVHRHLNHEPVLASPPSTLYRVRKFVRRHRVGVAATAVIAVALVAGIVGTTAGLLRAVRAERHARREAETARQVTGFLVDLFQVSDPDKARGSRITAREILDEGAGRIRRELADQPLVKARLMGTMGEVYNGLGLHTEAEALLREALSIQEARPGRGDRELVKSLNSLALLLINEGKYAEARSLAERALSVGLKTLGGNDDDVAWSMYNLGANSMLAGDHDQGEQLQRGALAVFRQHPESSQRGISWCLNDLGLAHLLREEHLEALPLLEEAAKIKEAMLGPDSPDLAITLNNIGYVLAMLDEFDRAEAVLQRAAGIFETALGPEHRLTAMVAHSLGEMYRREGDAKRARASFERALAIQEKVFGPSHREVALTLTSLAGLESETGSLSQAERRFGRAIAMYEAVGGTDYVELPPCLEEYAKHLDRAGRTVEAGEARERAQRIRAKAAPPGATEGSVAQSAGG